MTETVASIAAVARAIGRTIVCASDASERIAPLTRSWCLLEVMSTRAQRVEVYFPRSQLYDVDPEALVRLVDSRNARATCPADKRNVDALLQSASFDVDDEHMLAPSAASRSFDAVDERVRRALLDFLQRLHGFVEAGRKKSAP